MNNVQEQIIERFNINDKADPYFERKMWLIKNNVVIGLGVGSLFAGFLLKYNRQWTFMIMNIVGIVGISLSGIDNYDYHMAGRILYGMSAGVLFCLVPKMIVEMLPYDEYQKGYGAITNISIESFKIFFMLANFEYEFLQSVSKQLGTTETEDYFWRFFMLAPLPFVVLSLLIFGCCVRKDTFHFSINKGKHSKDEQMKILKRMILDQKDIYYEKKIKEKQEFGFLFARRLPDSFGPEALEQLLDDLEKGANKSIGCMQRAINRIKEKIGFADSLKGKVEGGIEKVEEGIEQAEEKVEQAEKAVGEVENAIQDIQEDDGGENENKQLLELKVENQEIAEKEDDPDKPKPKEDKVMK